MNERIQQLADKLWEEKYWTNPNTDKLLPAQLNRFAELIIRECFQIVDDYGVGQAHEPEMYLGESLKVSMKITDSAWKIKQHFGVE